MGIGRLEFLRLSGLALAGLIIDPLTAVAVNQNAYVNKKLGILFNKPQDWGFVSVKDFGRLKSEQIIGEGLGLTNERIWDDLGEPICVVTKYFEDLPEQKGVFSPTITLNVTPKSELDDIGFESFEELIEMSNYGTSKLLKDFRIKKVYDRYKINDCNIYEFDSEYLFEHIDIDQPLKVELKVLQAEHQDCYYVFNCHQSKAQNQNASKEFRAFINSIKMI